MTGLGSQNPCNQSVSQRFDRHEGSMNRAEMNEYKDRLLALRARMAGDVNQLHENSLRKSRSEANGDLSSMPIHMADIGSDNYEQEFSLSLMENEGVALAKIQT